MRKTKLSKQTKQSNSESLITTGEAALHCQVSAPCLKRWIRDGRLRAFRTPGSHHRIEVAEFQRFLLQYGMPGYPAASAEIRILLVDDEPALLDVLAEFLTSDPRAFKVETAMDGYEALIKVGAFRPALLVLDVVMPELDGIEVCRRLKASPETRGMKLVGLTGHPAAVASLLEAGADACLTKPVDLNRLKEEIDRLLGPAGRAGVTR